MWFAITLACASNKTTEQITQDSSDTNPSEDTGGAIDTAPPAIETSYILLPELQQLNRISMALRGVRPDAADILLVLDDPTELDAVVDRYLNSPEFGQTIRDLYAEILQMRAYDINLPALGPLTDKTSIERSNALSEEPLGLIENIVMSDRPLHEMVTLNSSHLDPTAAEMWNGHSYDVSQGGAQVVSWTDGRPPAGVLTSNALLVRWENNGDNNNRERANMVSTCLLYTSPSPRDLSTSRMPSSA